MDKPNIVVTYNASQEQQSLLLEVLGNVASLNFHTELAPAQREQALEEATILLPWNFPREIQPQDYPRLRRVLFIQLLSAGADHMPFAELPPRIIVASNPGAYAAPMAEHVMAMTLAQALAPARTAAETQGRPVRSIHPQPHALRKDGGHPGLWRDWPCHSQAHARLWHAHLRHQYQRNQSRASGFCGDTA